MNSFFLSLTLLILLGASQVASASFAENSRRHLSPKDFFGLLVQKFPVAEQLSQRQAIGDTCLFIGASNSNPLGLVDPVAGVPASNSPTAGTVRWWGSCVEKVLRVQNTVLSASADEKLWAKYWAGPLLTRFKDKNDSARPFHKFDEIEWNNLTSPQQLAQVRFLIEELIGPNPVIADFGLVKGIDELAALVVKVVPSDSSLKLNEANLQLILAVTLREEFLSY